MSSASTTYRNIEYRLLPGSEAAALQLLRLWDACRFVWNEFKEACELQNSLARGRKTEGRSFFTLGHAFKGPVG